MEQGVPNEVVQSVLDLLVNMMAPDTLRDHIDNLRIRWPGDARTDGDGTEGYVSFRTCADGVRCQTNETLAICSRMP